MAFGLDDIAIGTIVAGIIAGGTSLWNTRKQKEENRKQRQWNRDAFILQYLQQEQNRQREEAMQREAWQREDKSYQRTVEDMRQAGLNPLSLQGATGTSFSGLSSESASLQSPNTQAEQFDTSSIPQYLSLELERRDQKHRHTIEDEASSDSHRASMDEHNESLKRQQLLEAQEEEALAKADDQAYETKWKRDHNVSSNSDSKVNAVKEVAGDITKLISGKTPAEAVEAVTDTVKTFTAEQKKAFDTATDSISQEVYGKPYESLSWKEKGVVLLKMGKNKVTGGK